MKATRRKLDKELDAKPGLAKKAAGVPRGHQRWPALARDCRGRRGPRSGMDRPRLGANPDGAVRGDIRPDIDPVAEAVAICGAMRGIMSQWLIAPDNIDLDAVRDAYLAGLRRSWKL
jgi:hypothetical protein